MRVTIVGTGNMGTAFATALSPAHEVWIATRDPEKGKEAVVETGATGSGSYDEVVPDADVVILAVPWTAVADTLPLLGDLSGKVLLDITNPYVDGKLQPLEGTSTAEEIQTLVPDARVVKGFNHLFSTNVTRPEVGGEKASVFIAGDDVEAKDTIFTLARDMGFDPVDSGALSHTSHLERFVKLTNGLGLGEDRVIRVLRRG